jgi:hypothetical protein
MEQAVLNGKPVSTEDISAVLRQLADLKQFTLWRNPTQHDIGLELHHETPKPGPSIADRVAHLEPSERDIKRRGSKAWEEHTGKRFFLVKANGGTALIPAEYDRAVQDVKDGVIMGGLGTLLERMGTEHRPILHPALDAVDAARKKALAEAKAAKDEILVKEDDLLIARRRIAELEKQLAGDAASASAPTATPQAKKDK